MPRGLSVAHVSQVLLPSFLGRGWRCDPGSFACSRRRRWRVRGCEGMRGNEASLVMLEPRQRESRQPFKPQQHIWVRAHVVSRGRMDISNVGTTCVQVLPRVSSAGDGLTDVFDVRVCMYVRTCRRNKQQRADAMWGWRREGRWCGQRNSGEAVRASERASDT